jgi:hypothetical protein
MAAGYTTSLLVNAQVILPKILELPEFKHEPYKLINLMQARGKGLIPPAKLNEVLTSDSRTVDTYCFALRSITAGSARAHDHTLAAFGDTQKVTLSFSIVSGNYGVSLKMGGRNIMDQANMLAHDLRSALISIDNSIEAAIASYVSTNKTQHNSASGSYARFGEWDGTGYRWIIPASQENWVFQYIQEVMSINDYDVALDIITDNVGSAIAAQKAAQGAGNATNMGWQFDNMNIVKSRRVADSEYQATFYVMPAGTVGLLNRIPKENREGRSLKNYDYSNMNDELGSGLVNAVHYYETGSTTAATGGETQDVTFEYENSTDYAMLKAPLSAGATYTPIFKFVLDK